MHKLLALVAIVACATCSALAAPVTAVDWMEYVFGNDGFAISTPDPPSAVPANIHSAYGDVEAHFYNMVVSDDASFIVVVTARHPDDQRTPAQVLSDIQKHGIEGLKGEVLSQKPIMIENHPGVQIEFQSDQFHGRIRYFVAGRKSYQLVSLAKIGTPISGDTERFYDSFRLVNEP